MDQRAEGVDRRSATGIAECGKGIDENDSGFVFVPESGNRRLQISGYHLKVRRDAIESLMQVNPESGDALY